MRVFIGIKAPNEIQNQIIDWQEKHKDLPVRFIESRNLHLTLAPPWYENNIKKLVKNLQKFAFPKAFEVSFNEISIGPLSRPRLIWATGPKHQGLAKMQNEIAKFLKVPKQRYSSPHITIARFKERDALLIPEVNEAIEFKFEFSEITLFESKLSPLGANYNTVLRLPI
ncbi:MAG: 2'-5' RNA ligase [Candidatus Levybacteria bacterium RIFCSPHIGHO2_01_FULL_40_15b]|nr:MAG: 2'-5' RNA ligase [Candidatus Levybacteria bacterium RIFCSPHIGHO2_01_FULL_40_15b]